MSVHLRKWQLSDGRVSLLLDICGAGCRTARTLHMDLAGGGEFESQAQTIAKELTAIAELGSTQKHHAYRFNDELNAVSQYLIVLSRDGDRIEKPRALTVEWTFWELEKAPAVVKFPQCRGGQDVGQRIHVMDRHPLPGRLSKHGVPYWQAILLHQMSFCGLLMSEEERYDPSTDTTAGPG